METLRTPAVLASLITANLTPLAGMLLFGWSPASLLVLYYIDTFLGLGAVVVLVMAHVTGNDQGRPLSAKEWVIAIPALTLLGAIMAFPLFLPVWMVIGDDRQAWAALGERDFVYAALVQAGMSVYALVRQHRELKARDDDDRVLARRAIFLVARWVVMFMAMVTGLIPFLGPTIGGFLLVAIYAGASVYFELFPERAERFLRGSRAKPIVYEGDLDGPEARRPTAVDSRKGR